MSDGIGSNDGGDLRASVRHALRLAAGEAEPDVSHLAAAVPWMMAEARRRRARMPATPLAAVVPLAAKAIPRLAAAAAILVLLATVLLFRDASRTGAERQDLDSMLLGGADAGGVEQLLLGNIARQGGSDG
jgi:hypothetical protein